MRAFHCSWWGFFVAFFIWFAIAPLLSEIRTTLGLTKEEIWTSSIVGVAGTIFMRFLLGPLCDKFGARTLMAIILCMASIPTACTGAVNSATGLAVLRLFIGIAGGTFVMCQYWTTRMFTKEVAGAANALVGGWGNLGGGVTYVHLRRLLCRHCQAQSLTLCLSINNLQSTCCGICTLPSLQGIFRWRC